MACSIRWKLCKRFTLPEGSARKALGLQKVLETIQAFFIGRGLERTNGIGRENFTSGFRQLLGEVLVQGQGKSWLGVFAQRPKRYIPRLRVS